MSLVRMLKGNDEKSLELKRIIDMVAIDTEDISKDVLDSPILAPYILKNHKLAAQVGTAFDYLARFLMKHYQTQLTEEYIPDIYVAEYGLIQLLSKTSETNNKYEDIYQNALDLISDFVCNKFDKSVFKRIVGVSVYFAKLEEFYRSGYSYEKEKSLKYKIHPTVEKELYNQICVFKNAFEKKFNIESKHVSIIYNPTFGKCSQAVCGADADVIIEDTLIDFKTSKYLNNIDKDFKQLVAYYLFNNVNNPNNKVSSVALYLSRYGRFVEYKFKDKDRKMVEEATIEMDKFTDFLLITNGMCRF